MKPILFAKDETNFTTNGLGRLDCISCHVVEERNGMYELEAEISMSSPHASEIEQLSIIGAIPYDGGNIQAFYVYKITKPINGRFMVYARHITYRLSDIPCSPFSIEMSPTACADTLAGLKSHAMEACPFTFWTDVTTGSPYKQTVPASIRQRLGGIEGSVLDQFGGEYEWDNWMVKLHNKRGRLANVTGITLRYGKNITDINQEEEIANTVTGIVPFWIDTEGNDLVMLTEGVVYGEHAADYPYHLTQVIDLSDKYDEKPTEAQLRSAANVYVHKTGFGVPNVSIKLSFVDLWKTEEYKDIAPLEQVKLCDEVNVYFEKLGISAVAEVVKYDYDVLKERYISIEVGSLRTTLAQAVTDRDKEIDSEFVSQITRMATTVADATAWLTNAKGYVIAIKNTDGSWKELIFANSNSTETATAGIRFNNNGIGFWNKALHGGNVLDGPYGMAWTMDGRLGDLANNNYWNFYTGEFSLSSGTKVGSYPIQEYQDVKGRNYALGTYNGLKIVNGVVVEGSDTYNVSSQLVDAIVNAACLKISFWCKLTGVRTDGMTTWLRVGVHISGIVASTGQPGSSYFRRSFKNAVTEDDPDYGLCGGTLTGYISYFSQVTGVDIVLFDSYSSTQGTIEIKDVLLEVGADTSGYISPWSMAPEDEFTILGDLQDQIDGKIETFYQSNDPSISWTTADQRTAHTGDLWYRTSDDTQWRYNGSTWEEQVQNVPQDVYDKIDGKAQIFTTQPVPPYNVGDLWFNSTTSDIMTCVTARSSGNYQSSDWQKRNKYTDDTATTELNNSLNQHEVWKRLTNNSNDCIIYNNGSLGIKATAIIAGILSDAYKNNYWNLETGELRMTAGAKIKDTNADYSGQYVPTNSNYPANNWNTDALKQQNVGKTFNNTSDSNNPVTYVYKAESSSGSGNIKITFNPNCLTESGYDYVDLYYYYNLEWYSKRFTGSFDVNPVIPVNTFWLHWHTDTSAHDYYGWKIDSITSTTDPITYFSIGGGGLPSVVSTWTVVSGTSNMPESEHNPYSDNLDIGYKFETGITPTTKSYSWKLATLEDYIGGIAGSYTSDGVTTEDVFNALTEDGARQIIAFDANGHLYINAEYVRGGIIEVGGTNASENARFRVKNSIGTEVGRWDVNGFSANMGNFGNLKLDSSTSQAYVEGYKQIIPKDTSYTLNNGTSATNKGIELRYIINPFAEGYTEDFKIVAKVGITESGSHSSSTTVGRIILYKVSGSSRSQVASVGITNSGSSYTTYSLSATLDHAYGDDQSEYYLMYILIGRNTSSYSYYYSWLRSCKFDIYTTSTSGGVLRMAVFGSNEITGSLRGTLTGGVNATSFNCNNASIEIDAVDSYKTTYVVTDPNTGAYAKMNPTSFYTVYGDYQLYMQVASNAVDIHKVVNGATTDVKWNDGSDRRIKEEIKDITTEIATEIIDNTSPKSFKFINRDGRHYGVIAQEVREVLNNAGEEDIQLEHGIDIETEIVDKRFVDYEEFVPLLIKYVQDLRAEVNSLKSEINSMQQELTK